MGTKAKGSGRARAKGRVSVAQQLIAQAKQKLVQTPSLPSQHAIDHLRELCEYNDEVTSVCGRVSRADAAKSLADHFGWKGGHRDALDYVCRAQLGRESFSRSGK